MSTTKPKSIAHIRRAIRRNAIPKDQAFVVLTIADLSWCCPSETIAAFLNIRYSRVNRVRQAVQRPLRRRYAGTIRHWLCRRSYAEWNVSSLKDAMEMNKRRGIPWVVVAERKGARTWKSIYRAAQRNPQLAA